MSDERERDVCLSLGDISMGAWWGCVCVCVYRAPILALPGIHWDGSTLPRDEVRTL